MTEQDSRIDLRDLLTSLGHRQSVYVTDGDGLYEVIGLKRRGVFSLLDCSGDDAEPVELSAVTLALGYELVTPAKSSTIA